MDDATTGRHAGVRAGLLLLTAAAAAAVTVHLALARAEAPPAGPGGGSGPNYLSPIAMVADKAGKTIYIAQATGRRVDVFDVATRKVTASIDLALPVSGVTISPDGTKLYATAGRAKGRLFAIDVKTRKITAQIPVGHTPMSPVVSPDGKTVYVCNRFNNAIGVVNLASSKQAASIPVPRQPVSADISKDGKTLIVANHLITDMENFGRIRSKVSIIDTASRKVASTIKLPDGATTLRRVRLSPDGKYAALTHRLGRYHLPRAQIERGWANTNMVCIIDVAKRTMINTVPLDDVDYGASNPWAIAWSSGGDILYVSHASNHEISVINFRDLIAKFAKSVTKKRGSWVQNDLSYIVKMRRRIKLKGNGPRSMVVIDGKAYVGEYFTDSLSVVDLTGREKQQVKSIALGPKREMTAARRGEMLFNDAQMCFQRWLCCASCHPGGRNDGLVWDLLNDGMGTPKKTKSLLWAHKTPPMMLTGKTHPPGRTKSTNGSTTDAEATIRSHIRHIQFAVRPEKDTLAILEYLKSLKPAANPRLVNGKLSQAALRGKILFKTAECASCHSGELFTDRKKHMVGTGKGIEAAKFVSFDTPTLIEAWRTAPYLSRGQAATILDVLSKKHNPEDMHGKTSNLTKQQLADLAAYVMSL